MLIRRETRPRQSAGTWNTTDLPEPVGSSHKDVSVSASDDIDRRPLCVALEIVKSPIFRQEIAHHLVAVVGNAFVDAGDLVQSLRGLLPLTEIEAGPWLDWVEVAVGGSSSRVQSRIDYEDLLISSRTDPCQPNPEFRL